MSKNALGELFQAPIDKFNIMVKNLPSSEFPGILRFFQDRYSLLVNLK